MHHAKSVGGDRLDHDSLLFQVIVEIGQIAQSYGVSGHVAQAHMAFIRII